MEKKKRFYDDPDAPMTAVIGIIAVLTVYLLIVGLEALFFNFQQQQMKEKTYGYAFDKLRNAHSQQQQQLYTYRWINEATGVVAIPIDEAMALTAAELQQAAATQPIAQE